MEVESVNHCIVSSCRWWTTTWPRCSLISCLPCTYTQAIFVMIFCPRGLWVSSAHQSNAVYCTYTPDSYKHLNHTITLWAEIIPVQLRSAPLCDKSTFKHGDDDEPPQTNLPPIIADSRDPGGEVRLKVWGAGVTQGWSSSSSLLLAPKVLLEDQWPMKTIHSTPLQSH